MSAAFERLMSTRRQLHEMSARRHLHCWLEIVSRCKTKFLFQVKRIAFERECHSNAPMVRTATPSFKTFLRVHDAHDFADDVIMNSLTEHEAVTTVQEKQRLQLH
jgi:hypothetical protein